MIQYDQNALDEASNMYKRAQITSNQRNIIQILSSKLCEYIPMDILPMKGFAIMAAIDWQKQHQLPASEVETFTPEKRVQFMEYALNHMKNNVIRILRDRVNEDQIDEGIRATLEYYRKTLAQR